MPALIHPLIVLPGITATTLRDLYPVNPENVWNLHNYLDKSYARILLHPDDRRYEAHEPARLVADQLFEPIYGELIEELRYNLSSEGLSVPVYPFPYDWRQPLHHTVEQLRHFIGEVIIRTRLTRPYHEAGYGTSTCPARVNLVGHSMGGLIIAGYLHDHGFSKVDKVATLGTPFRGSVETVFKTAVGTGSIDLFGGKSREREFARMTPALYHLLPTFAGAIRTQAGPPPDLFQAANWQTGIHQTLQSFLDRHSLEPHRQAATLLQEMLDEARSFLAKVEALRLADSSNGLVGGSRGWLSLIGVGEPTRQSFSIATAGSSHYFRFSNEDLTDRWKSTGAARAQTGDGTVPFLGARTSFIPEEEVVCLSPEEFDFFECKDRATSVIGLHGQLPNMNLAQRWIVSHCKGEKYGDLSGWPSPLATKPWHPPVSGARELSV